MRSLCGRVLRVGVSGVSNRSRLLWNVGNRRNRVDPLSIVLVPTRDVIHVVADVSSTFLKPTSVIAGLHVTFSLWMRSNPTGDKPTRDSMVVFSHGRFNSERNTSKLFR